MSKIFSTEKPKNSSTSLNSRNVQDRATEQSLNLPWRLISLLSFSPIVYATYYASDSEYKEDIFASLIISVFGYILTDYMVPLVAMKLKPKLYGIDIGKRGLRGLNDGEKVPESLGLVSSFSLLVCIGLTEVFTSHKNLNKYNAALSSICFATLLGLVDDIIDIKWRHKLLIGPFMCLPLLLSYDGGTIISLPLSIKQQIEKLSFLTIFGVDFNLAGGLVDLSSLYFVYMLALVIFCTNSINIYAGINGLEVGQSFVIGLFIAFMNLLEVINNSSEQHLFSFTLIMPFVTTSLALLKHNFYPAEVFVGDVFPYSAGMTISVAAILGHYPKSLLLLLLPQVFNFIYSTPQLFGLIACPRHRLPRVNLKTGFLEASKTSETSNKSNKTLLCLVLDILGPLHERTLCFILLSLQAICSVFGLVIRTLLGEIFKQN